MCRVCVCVCVYVRERERERGREIACVCLCVFVFVDERERRERGRERDGFVGSVVCYVSCDTDKIVSFLQEAYSEDKRSRVFLCFFSSFFSFLSPSEDWLYSTCTVLT